MLQIRQIDFANRKAFVIIQNMTVCRMKQENVNTAHRKYKRYKFLYIRKEHCPGKKY